MFASPGLKDFPVKVNFALRVACIMILPSNADISEEK